MASQGIHIRMFCEMFSGVYKFGILEQRGDKKYAAKLVFEEVPDGMYINPTFTVPMDDAGNLKELVRDLDAAGLSKDQTAGELSATKRHLEDMRLLAKVKGKTHD